MNLLLQMTKHSFHLGAWIIAIWFIENFISQFLCMTSWSVVCNKTWPHKIKFIKCWQYTFRNIQTENWTINDFFFSTTLQFHLIIIIKFLAKEYTKWCNSTLCLKLNSSLLYTTNNHKRTHCYWKQRGKC